jgi:hypothetical protein
MATVTLPYTFVGGMRAIADQVNADFAALVNAINTGTKVVLQAATNFYVNGTSGNDNNTGLSPSSAWQTLQGASNGLYNYDFAGFPVVVNIAPGTYTGFAISGLIAGLYNPQLLIFRGVVNNPGSVVVNPGLMYPNCVHAINGSIIQLEGMRFTTTGSNNNGLWVANSLVTWQSCDFGPMPSGAHIVATDFSHVRAIGNYTISGGGYEHYFVTNQAQLSAGAGLRGPVTPQITVTVTTNPTFTDAFIRCESCALADFGGGVFFGTPAAISFSGTAVGPRFIVARCSVINTYAGGANFFPGNAAGTTDATSYGVYQ